MIQPNAILSLLDIINKTDFNLQDYLHSALYNILMKIKIDLIDSIQKAQKVKMYLGSYMTSAPYKDN